MQRECYPPLKGATNGLYLHPAYAHVAAISLKCFSAQHHHHHHRYQSIDAIHGREFGPGSAGIFQTHGLFGAGFRSLIGTGIMGTAMVWLSSPPMVPGWRCSDHLLVSPRVADKV